MKQTVIWFDAILEDIDPKHERELFLLDLYGTAFQVFNERDINRVNDVIEARNEFYDGENYSKNGASVHEILYILAKRMQFLISFSQKIDENALKRDKIVQKNAKKLQIWMQRCFKSDGNGSIFPLKCAKKDQRGVEIWYQMQAYIAENYPI